ncbi:hypothetical protein B566_EDAN001840 [Ephemera danica]|nr:hypothetical protein B566_EDAN001840 [Ephemera danica]
MRNWVHILRVIFFIHLHLLEMELLTEDSVATPIHELMHAIGFFHEQRMEYNFRIEYSSPFGQGYDFNSVMHYSETAFSRNGQPTIRTKPANIRIGQRDGISATDVAKINLMYGCRR